MRAMVTLVTLMIAGSRVGMAQAPVPVPPGSIVRVSSECGDDGRGEDRAAASCRPVRGVVVSADAVGLIWKPEGGSAVEARPWSSISGLEVSRGKRRQVVKGLWIGAAVAAVPGALSGASYARTCDCPDPNTAAGAAIGALIFAVPGALLGAGIGALVRTGRWETVSPPRILLSAAHMPRGVNVGVTLGF